MRSTIVILLIVLSAFCSAQGQMMQQPKLLSQRPPEYPAEGKRLRVEGKVLLNAHIGTDGKVKGTEFAQGQFTYQGKQYDIASSAELDQMAPAIRPTVLSLIQSAQHSALLWKFTPAMLGGTPVEATIVIPFTYKLTVLPNSPPASRPQKKK